MGVSLSNFHLEISEYFLVVSSIDTNVHFSFLLLNYTILSPCRKRKKLHNLELPVLYRLFPRRKSQPSGNSRGFRALFISGDQMSVVMQSSRF